MVGEDPCPEQTILLSPPWIPACAGKTAVGDVSLDLGTKHTNEYTLATVRPELVEGPVGLRQCNIKRCR
jgi:hypothetical protein